MALGGCHSRLIAQQTYCAARTCTLIIAGAQVCFTMAKAKKVSIADTRKPKHPLDANRPSKGGKNQRDAATVGAVFKCEVAS